MSDPIGNINNKNLGNDDSSFMPTPEKFQAEQDALKKVHDPKDFSEIRPRNDYDDLDDQQDEKTEQEKYIKKAQNQDITTNKIIFRFCFIVLPPLR